MCDALRAVVALYGAFRAHFAESDPLQHIPHPRPLAWLLWLPPDEFGVARREGFAVVVFACENG
jgi:hypothetical protein